MRVPTLAILTSLCTVLTAPRAIASQPGNIELCNHFPVPLRFAVAWKTGGVAYAKGWYTVGSGHCSRITLGVPSFYWRAETNDYIEPDGRTVSTAWGAHDHGFCTTKNGFNYLRADGPCGKAKRKGYIASFLRTDGSPIYQTVNINHDGTSSQSIGAGHFQEIEKP